MTSRTVEKMSDQQKAEEQASLEISNTLTNLDHALARARKALAVLQKPGVDPNGYRFGVNGQWYPSVMASDCTMSNGLRSSCWEEAA